MRVLPAEDNESLARATAAILNNGSFEVATLRNAIRAADDVE